MQEGREEILKKDEIRQIQFIKEKEKAELVKEEQERENRLRVS